ncbi:hypothetical protein AMTR_s00044p00037180 [Amborella trichopoda]|uniref:Protein ACCUMULATION AND REPLICATION OF CHLOROPLASTS 3 n=1 Tax=Amborella trichopoda TaxID=13333 RepID=U5D9J7_AMBTC|nr:hypothetical protein AMTR_s00044p00037180 [Amborella trichopoda]
MELLSPNPLSNLSPALFLHCSPSKLCFHSQFFCNKLSIGKNDRVSTPLRIDWGLSNGGNFSRFSFCSYRKTGHEELELGQNGGQVDVVGIGSRKDAFLNFCLNSPLISPLARFWTVNAADSKKFHLLQKTTGKDLVQSLVEDVSLKHCNHRALILVANAGYGSDHHIITELISAVRSSDGLAVCIVVKPFSFEGQKRQYEIEELVKKLRNQSNFCIVVETNALLEKDAVTLTEAVRSANNAVLLAVNAVSVLVSDVHSKLLETPKAKMKEVGFLEALEILNDYGEGKVGFGAGYSIKSSTLRAVFDCPFFIGGIPKDSNGTVICTITSSEFMEKSDLNVFINVFRQATQFNGKVICSNIMEPDLEQHLVLTTIIAIDYNKQKVAQKRSFFSGLARHFPFVFSFLGRDRDSKSDELPSEQSLKSSRSSKKESCPSDVGTTHASNVQNPIEHADDSDGTQFSRNHEENSASRGNFETLALIILDSFCESKFNHGDGRTEVGFSETFSESVAYSSDYLSEGEHSFHRESLAGWNEVPVSLIAQEWAKERAATIQATPRMDEFNSYNLPVGVKHSQVSKDDHLSSCIPQLAEEKKLDDKNGEVMHDGPSFDALTDASFEVVKDIYNAASTLLVGKTDNGSKKQGLLSTRAASMLEAERDSPRKWNPVMEMPYRRGVYKGRCQGGLPEGKGRLTLTDGSFYDGMWRQGKRSGLGTFYYSNGDMFQGSWREDLIHGKGWFYFHTGDRWFANFWKGKANGEGRFYSKDGYVFFGHFQDGWRHGQCLYIEADGTRWVEVWNEGVLVSRKLLETSTKTA